MYSRIVVGIDGSELANKALRHAVALAKQNSARLFAVTATEPAMIMAPGAEAIGVNTGEIIAQLEAAKARSAAATLAEAKALAEAEGQAIDAIHVPTTTAADAILGTAERQGANLIVMGSHGRRGLGRLLLGSQAGEVLARSTVPVLVVK
jgi:nucleotide-binding universal stress UspA family protein